MDLKKDDIIISPYDSPFEIACTLINAQREAINLVTNDTVMLDSFTKEDLRKIGEHLVNYCRTEERKG